MTARPATLAAVMLAALSAGGAAAAESPLLGVVEAYHSAALVRVDAATLQPLPGARVPLGRGSGAWSFSPDGSRVAIGSYAALGLRIVDARTMRRVRDISTRNGEMEFVAWLTPRRIVGWELSGVFAVDPVTGKRLRYESIAGHLMGAEAARDSVVLLLSPYERVRSCRLAVAGLEGRTRFVELDRVRCSAVITIDDDVPAESRRPGLAVDAAGHRAFVVAEIDLRTLRVDYHLLAERTPSARAKGPLPGAVRTVRWVSGGFLAVAGTDTSPPLADRRARETPAGLRLVDTSSWTSRLLDASATSVDVAGSTIYGFGGYFDDDNRYVGDGIKAFGADGLLRFHALAGEPVWITLARTTLYAYGKRLVALDAWSGRTLGQAYFGLAEVLGQRLRAWR